MTDDEDPRLLSDASWKVLLPIGGLLGGLGVGTLRVWFVGAQFVEAVVIATAGGMIGSTLGMSLVLLGARRFGRADLRSFQGLGLMVLAAALVLWFALTLLDPVLRGV